METGSIGEALAVVTGPALLMLLGGATAAWASIPQRPQACMQNFSAGLLISAVAGELFPLMSQQDSSGLGLVAGFVLGLVAMFGLGHLMEGDDEEEAPAEENAVSNIATPMLWSPASRELQSLAMAEFKKEVEALSAGILRLEGSVKDAVKDGSREGIDENLHSLMYQVDRARRRLRTEPLDERNIKRMGEHVEELREGLVAVAKANSGGQALKALDAFERCLDHIHEHSEREKFRRWRLPHQREPSAVFKETIPWALVFAVSVDSAVDGFLIGLAYSAAASAGWCMSIATAIEMGFLGLSFAATLRNSIRSVAKRACLAVLPPVILSISGLIGCVIGDQVKDNQVLFTGFIAFSVVALLFLVTQELLAEAREVAGDDHFVNSVLFFGLLAGILLERFVG